MLGLLVKNSALMVVGMYFVSIVQDRVVWCASFLAHKQCAIVEAPKGSVLFS